MTDATQTVLKINSSSRVNGSVSRQLTDRLASRFLAAAPATSIIERNVNDGLSSISEDWVNANFTPKDARNDAQNTLLAQSDTLVAELRAADILLIGLPIYNFGVPAALKEWVDLICRAGETFAYSETGPAGLLTGKRAIVTVASGGVPVGSPVDHATTYLTQVLAFIGVTDVTYVAATGLAMDAEGPVTSAEAEIDALDLKQAA